MCCLMTIKQHTASCWTWTGSAESRSEEVESAIGVFISFYGGAVD